MTWGIPVSQAAIYGAALVVIVITWAIAYDRPPWQATHWTDDIE